MTVAATRRLAKVIEDHGNRQALTSTDNRQALVRPIAVHSDDPTRT